MKAKIGLFFMIILSITISCGKKSNSERKDPEADPRAPLIDPQLDGPQKPDPIMVSRGILDCYDHGGYLTDCTMKERVLSERQSVLSKFILDYSFSCVGSQLAIVVQFDALMVPLKQEENQKIELIGNGPFTLKDSDPKWSKSGDVQPSCSLDIVNFSVSSI